MFWVGLDLFVFVCDNIIKRLTTAKMFSWPKNPDKGSKAFF